MSRMFPFSAPLWAQQATHPVGVLAWLATPAALLGAWYSALGGVAFAPLLVWGWTLVGLVPAAVSARAPEDVERRWRALPIGAADRLLMALATQLPPALVLAAALGVAPLVSGTGAARQPLLLAVALAAGFTGTTLGLAVGAHARRGWQLAGGLAFMIALCFAGAYMGNSPVAMATPTGVGHAALVALDKGDMVRFVTMTAGLALGGVAAAIVAVMGYGRR